MKFPRVSYQKNYGGKYVPIVTYLDLYSIQYQTYLGCEHRILSYNRTSNYGTYYFKHTYIDIVYVARRA